MKHLIQDSKYQGTDSKPDHMNTKCKFYVVYSKYRIVLDVSVTENPIFKGS
jgi:hypothetical protein